MYACQPKFDPMDKRANAKRRDMLIHDNSLCLMRYVMIDGVTALS